MLFISISLSALFQPIHNNMIAVSLKNICQIYIHIHKIVRKLKWLSRCLSMRNSVFEQIHISFSRDKISTNKIIKFYLPTMKKDEKNGLM